jgi:hypothetical protein
MSTLKPHQIGFVIGLVALVLSCDVAGGLFSQSELADMYEVWIDLDGLPLGDGDVIRSASTLVPVIDSPGGISVPERLSLVLVDLNGTEAARLTFVSGTGSGQDAEDLSLRAVRTMKGALPSFSVPGDLAEGYYSLETYLYDSSGRVLSSASTLVLVYNGLIPTPRIETFPSSPAKGQPVFLRLVTGLPGDLDPWVRWYVGAGIRKEGYASDFADRLVWQIPESEGFFSVRAELFPFKPPVEALPRSFSRIEPLLSAFRADLIIAVGPAHTTSVFDDLDLASIVDFKSDPEAQLVELADRATLPLLIIGSPYPESHQYGYGHSLQAGSGYLIPGTILPQTGAPFALCIAFDPAEHPGASGAMVTFYDTDTETTFLRLGVSGGLPYLEAGDRIIQAFTDIPAGLSHLVLEVVPSGSDTAEAMATLFLDNELVGNGVVSSSLFTPAGPVMTLVGGPEGLDAVYEELLVVKGRYQAFLVAKAREYGNSLIAASGFEGGTLGRGISVQGPAEAKDGFIELSQETSLEIPVPPGGFTVAIEGYGAYPGLVLEMDDGSLMTLLMGKPLLDLLPETEAGEEPGIAAMDGSETDSGGGAGSVSAGFPIPAGGLAPLNHAISLSVEAVAGGLRISDNAGRNERIPTSVSASILRVQPAGSSPLVIESVMVRTFSSADSVRRTDSITLVPPAEEVN